MRSKKQLELDLKEAYTKLHWSEMRLESHIGNILETDEYRRLKGHDSEEKAGILIQKWESEPSNKIPIGYKLVKTEYEKEALSIVNRTYIGWIDNDLYDIATDSKEVSLLNLAGVLDLWFKPVYKEDKPKLPMINGHDGIYSSENGTIKYGCAILQESWFRISPNNRQINHIVLDSGVIINERQISKIREYLKFNYKC